MRDTHDWGGMTKEFPFVPKKEDDMERDGIWHWQMYPDCQDEAMLVDEEWDQEVEDYISDLTREYGE